MLARLIQLSAGPVEVLGRGLRGRRLFGGRRRGRFRPGSGGLVGGRFRLGQRLFHDLIKGQRRLGLLHRLRPGGRCPGIGRGGVRGGSAQGDDPLQDGNHGLVIDVSHIDHPLAAGGIVHRQEGVVGAPLFHPADPRQGQLGEPPCFLGEMGKLTAVKPVHRQQDAVFPAAEDRAVIQADDVLPAAALGVTGQGPPDGFVLSPLPRQEVSFRGRSGLIHDLTQVFPCQHSAPPHRSGRTGGFSWIILPPAAAHKGPLETPHNKYPPAKPGVFHMRA